MLVSFNLLIKKNPIFMFAQSYDEHLLFVKFKTICFNNRTLRQFVILETFIFIL